MPWGHQEGVLSTGAFNAHKLVHWKQPTAANILAFRSGFVTLLTDDTLPLLSP